MRIPDRVIGAVPLDGVVLLSSCGDGSEVAGLPDRQASPGVIVGQPAPAASTIPAELFSEAPVEFTSQVKALT